MELGVWIKRLLGSKAEPEARECIDKTLYYKLLDASPDSIVFYTDENGCIGANNKFLEFFGFESLDEFMKTGTSLQQLFSDEDESVICENDTVWLNFIKRAYPQGYGVRYVDVRQKVHHVQLHVETIEHEGVSMYYITLHSSEDMHDLQARLVSANLQTKELVAKIGLQFRTPMQSILGFVNLLQQSRMDETQEAYLRQVSLSARELIVTIENLLDSQNVGEKTTTQCSGRMYFWHEIQMLVASFEQKALDKRVTLVFESDDAIPEVVEGDIKKLKQLLFALLTYALQVAREDTKVTLQCERMSGSNILLIDFHVSISDSLADPNRDDLTLMRKLTNLLQGDIELSTENHKASLHVKIPFSGNAQEPLTPAPSAPSKELRIMVVEDNTINQNLMRLLLEGYGIQVTLAANGQEAIDTAALEPFDLVFMDIDMPLVNGVEATQTIKNARADDNAPMPIIAVTALALEGDRERLLAAGLDDYISKPLTREMLEFILNKYLDMRL